MKQVIYKHPTSFHPVAGLLRTGINVLDDSIAEYLIKHKVVKEVKETLDSSKTKKKKK